MGAKGIYIQLVQGGLSPVGACGVMGNMQAESALRAGNAQDSYGRGDAEYTAAVDAGLQDFVGDSIGYGLCQWTYAPRKRKLLEYARSLGVSIADETMQVAFCLRELREDYPALFTFLCTAKGVYEAARRVCVEYERPAVNNVEERAQAADNFFMQFGNIEVDLTTPAESAPATPTELTQSTGGADASVESGSWPPRELSIGMSGADVAALQAILAALGFGGVPGVYDASTEALVKVFQSRNSLKADGIAGNKTWTALLALAQR